MYKFYRGCTLSEAQDIYVALDSGNIEMRQPVQYWTDSLEKAEMYARRHDNGAVIAVEMDEMPRGFNNHFSVGEGDSTATTIRQWAVNAEYFRNHFSTVVEEATIALVH